MTSPIRDPSRYGRIDNETADVCFTLLAACLRRDTDGAELLLEGKDLRRLLLAMTSLTATALADQYGGPQRLAEHLAAWRPGMRLGERPGVG